MNLQRINVTGWIIALLFLIMLSAEAFSQSIQIGAKAGYGSTWLMNKNISENGPISEDNNYLVSFGHTKGICVGYYLHQNSYYNYLIYGVNAELLVTDHNQKFRRIVEADGYKNEILYNANLKFIDIPVMFRVTPEHGPYFEIGPQISMLTSATGITANFTKNSASDNDILNDYKKMNISGILGFGVDINPSEQFAIIAGLRFMYGFTDITQPQQSEVPRYSPTHAVSGTFMLGGVYKINYYH